MHILDSLFDWFLSATWRGALLVLAVLLVQAAFRQRLPANWRYALWIPVVFVLATPWLPRSSWSLENWIGAESAATATGGEVLPSVGVAGAANQTATDTATVGDSILAASQAPASAWDFAAILGAVWLSGAVGFLAIGAIAYRRNLRRMRRSAVAAVGIEAELAEAARVCGLERTPGLIVSSSVDGPAITGFFRPLLLLPADFRDRFTGEERALILQHELHHLKRGDLHGNGLLVLLQALHWCNPLVWFAFARLRADRELACDAAVLGNSTGDRRAVYGNALLKLGAEPGDRSLFRLAFVGLLGEGFSWRSRIRAIGAHRRVSRAWAVPGIALIAGLLLAGGTRAEKEPEAGATATTAAEKKKVNAGADRQASVSQIETEAATEASATKTRAEQIIIPGIDFHEVPLGDAVDFLQAQARILDPEKQGLGIVVAPDSETANADTEITLVLNQVSLAVALKHLATLSNCRVEYGGQAVVLKPAGQATAEAENDSADTKTAAPKADGIVFSEIDFRSVSMEVVLKRLQDRSRELDPEGTGFTIAVAPEAGEGWKHKVLTMMLTDLSFAEAMEQIASAMEMELVFEDRFALLKPQP